MYADLLTLLFVNIRLERYSSYKENTSKQFYLTETCHLLSYYFSGQSQCKHKLTVSLSSHYFYAILAEQTLNFSATFQRLLLEFERICFAIITDYSHPSTSRFAGR